MLSYDEMYHEVLKLQAEDEIHNLISDYCFEHNMALQMRYYAHWSRREDIRHEMPWGNTTGHAHLEYNNPWADRVRHPHDARVLPAGSLFIHLITTPVIEVAEDLQSARCVFLSPGIEASAVRAREGKDMGAWAYSKYAFELIREDGQWKIWHSRIFPVFRNDYFKDFAKAPEADLTATKFRDGLEDFHAFFRYTPDCVMPRSEPEIPLPYDTWEPGWNFGVD